MADVTNNTLNAYFKNRVKYHAASRLASQTGEGLAQALNVDGHIVTTAKIWAAPATAFPNNADKNNVDATDATNDLVAVFKTPVEIAEGIMSEVSSVDFWATDKAGVKSGKVWTNTAYPAVKLYENVPMTAVKGSDGGGKFQAFEILAAADGYSEGTLRVNDWVAPTSVADLTTGKVVAGFSGIPMFKGEALPKDTTRWAAALGTWEFVYIAGMLTFEPGYTPQNKATDAVDSKTFKSVVTLTAFKYCGDYLTDTITDINTKVETAVDELNTAISNAREIAKVSVTLKGGMAAPANTGKTIDSEISDGVLTMTINAEVLTVKDGKREIIQPDIAYDAEKGITTLTANYGTNLPLETETWELTYRI